MNEWTHFFIKNIPLTLYSRKGWCWLCERGELETGTDCHILTQGSSDHSSTSFSSWLGCSTVGHWGPKPSVCSWHLVLNWLQLWLELNWLKPSVAPGYIIVWRPPASCGRMHLHRIRPRPQVKVISSTGCTYFAVLLLIYTGASLDWRLYQGSICYSSISPSCIKYI